MPRRPPPNPGQDSALKRLREAAGLSQQELASRIGVGITTISRWERGVSPAMMSVPQMKALCRELGMTIEELPDDFGPITESEQVG
jgi:putative transcriptional regulator